MESCISNELQSAIGEYFSCLKSSGAACLPLLGKIAPTEVERELQMRFQYPDRELVSYFSEANGYRASTLADISSNPEFAWGMWPLSLDEAATHYDSWQAAGYADLPDYWPDRFFPMMWDGEGNYLLANCDVASPTYGAVYDLTEGVGCNRLANSISDFFLASCREFELGLRRYSSPHRASINQRRNYVMRAAQLYGYTPYFDRYGSMDTQIVDWK